MISPNSCLIFASIVSRIHAAPAIDKPRSTPSNTQSSFVGFVSDPNGRGTLSPVISCLLTLLFCVWSALHLNIPVKDQSLLQHLLVNARWIITGIYAPELVVFTAWSQWCSARILSNIVRVEGHACERSNTAFRTHSDEWTLTHGFFASTGGFAFDVRHLKNDFLPSGYPERLTLTARGMALLARCGQLPDVTQADITDKSKANDIAEALVLIQASWMLVQIIGRLLARMPVTLLEVNTIAHV